MNSMSAMERFQRQRIMERLDDKEAGTKATVQQPVQQAQQANPTQQGNLIIPPGFDFTYFSLNSLFRNRSTQQENKITFSAVLQSDSKSGVMGITKAASQVTHLQISPVVLSRKFISSTTAIEDLYFQKLYVLVTEFATQAFNSHNGFKYHFSFLVEQDPADMTQLIATPVIDTFSLPNAIRFDNVLSFEFYTHKPYELEPDQYECYCNYAGAFLRFRRVDGQVHNLSNLDIVFLDNFAVPGLVSNENKLAPTFKQNQYRISVVDLYNFDIPIAVDPNIQASINRPADSTLGIYNYNMVFNCLPAVATQITSTIPHGLVNGDSVQVVNTNLNVVNGIVGTWSVTVTSPTQFTIPFDSTITAQPFQVTIYQLPRISIDRINSIFVKIVTKKIEFGFKLASKSNTADNNLVVIAK